MQQINVQFAHGHSLQPWSCPCATCIWLLNPAPILVPKEVLTLYNLHWWCFTFYELVQTLYLYSRWSSSVVTCAGGVFLNALVHLRMCTQLSGGDSCGFMWWRLYVVMRSNLLHRGQFLHLLKLQFMVCIGLQPGNCLIHFFVASHDLAHDSPPQSWWLA